MKHRRFLILDDRIENSKKHFPPKPSHSCNVKILTLSTALNPAFEAGEGKHHSGSSGSGWSLRRKFEAAHLSVSQGVDTFKRVSSVLTSNSSLSNDPLLKVSEGRPRRSNRTRDLGITNLKKFDLTLEKMANRDCSEKK
jgi:hypothetical protein